MRQFKRSQRLSGQMLKDISQLLEGELSELVPGMVTFTQVRLTDDLRYAKVYYSYLGNEEDKVRVGEYLMQERRRIRHEVGRLLHVRNIPELDFRFDPSIEEGIKIEKLLNEISNDDDDQQTS